MFSNTHVFARACRIWFIYWTTRMTFSTTTYPKIYTDRKWWILSLDQCVCTNTRMIRNTELTTLCITSTILLKFLSYTYNEVIRCKIQNHWAEMVFKINYACWYNHQFQEWSSEIESGRSEEHTSELQSR